MTTQTIRKQPQATPPPATEELVAKTRPETEEVKDAADAILDEIESVLEEYEDGKPKQKVAYTLADAIREGCALAPQAFNAFTNEKGETCALAAALEAVKKRTAA